MVSKLVVPSLVIVLAVTGAILYSWSGSPGTGGSIPRGPGKQPAKSAVPWTRRSETHEQVHNENGPRSGQSTKRERLLGMLQSEVPELNEEQLTLYLVQHGRSTTSLLVVSHLTKDMNFLREAVAVDRNDKACNLEMALQGRAQDERKQAIGTFQMVDPDNILGQYLLALAAFEDDSPVRGMEILARADTMDQYRDYNLQKRQGIEAAYLSAGFTPEESRICALRLVQSSVNSRMLKLSSHLNAQLSSCKETGRLADATNLARISMRISATLDANARSFVDHAVALTIAVGVLGNFQSDEVVTTDGESVGHKLAAYKSEKEKIMDLAHFSMNIMQDMSLKDIDAYLQLAEEHGELEAVRRTMKQSASQAQ